MTLIADPAKQGLSTALQFVWDPVALDYVVATQAGGGGGGGGGAVTVANGADIAEGATTDAEAAAGDGSVISILKRLRTLLSSALAVNLSDGSGNLIDSSSLGQPSLASGKRGLLVIPHKDSTFQISATSSILVAQDPAIGWATYVRRASDGLVMNPTDQAQLPAALGASGGLKVEGIAGGVAQPVSIAAAVDVSDRAGRALGAVSMADGAAIVQGAKADAVWDGVTVSTTFSAVLKYIGQKVEAVRALLAGTLRSAKREIGYANVALYAEAVAGVIAETAITINKSLAFAAPASSTSNGASAAKELVIYGIMLSWIATTTTANTCRVRLRVNPAGAAIITSPIAFTLRISWESATFIANEGELQPILFNEPIIIPNPGTFMATLACVAANGTLDIQILAYERTP